MSSYLDGIIGGTGLNAYATLAASFVQPGVGSNISVQLDHSGWSAVGLVVFAEVGGTYQVVSIPDATHLVMKNLGSAGNAAPGITVPANGRMTAAGASGTGGSTIPAPALVATSNVTQSGDQIVDGVHTNTLAAGSAVLCVGQTNPAQNGYKVVNNAGAWTDPTFYNSDATVAAANGHLSGTALDGTANKGLQWYQQSGTTIAGAKVWARPINGTYFAPTPTGNVAIDTPILRALCDLLVANPGSTLQLAASPATDYHTNEDLILDHARGATIRGGGGSFASGSRIVREGRSVGTKITASFVQPASGLLVAGARTVVGTVLASVTSTAEINALPKGGVGKVVEVDATGTPTYYTIIRVTDGTTLELLPTSYNQVAAGTTIPAYGRLRVSDALIQARSCNGAKIQGVSLVALDPCFGGSLVLCDGRIFGNDCVRNKLEYATLQTQNNYLNNFNNYPATSIPLLSYGAASIPADTLTGSCNYCFRLRVEYTGATTYRYTTEFRADGPFDWEETGLSTAAPHALLGTATGLTWNPVNSAHTVGTIYEATIGASGMTVINGYSNTIEHSDAAFLFDVANMAGVGNHVGPQISTQVIGGQVAWMNGSAIHVDIDPEPGSGLGRGGVHLYNCNGSKVRFVSGDESSGGPLIRLDGGSHTIHCTPSINSGAVLGKDCAIRASGCNAIHIEGDFSFANRVIDFHGPSTNIKCTIGNIVPPRLYDGTLASMCTGAFLQRNITWLGACSGTVLASDFIDSPVIQGLGITSIGLCRTESTTSLANGANADIVLNSDLVRLNAFTAPVTISGIRLSNLRAGLPVDLYWSAPYPLTLTDGDVASTAAWRLRTGTAGPITIAAPLSGGHAWFRAIYSTAYGAWMIVAHSQRGVYINAQTGTTYTLTASDFYSALVKASNAAAIAVTVPQDVVAAGQTCSIMQGAAGQVTLSAGAGVSLINAKSNLTRAQNSVLNVTCLDPTHGATIYLVSGDMS